MKKLIFVFLGIFLIEMISASPQISNVFINPENPALSEEVEICADVIDGSGINIVRINLRREEPLWNWGLVMDKESNKYCKTLSPNFMKTESEDKTRSYYISARNKLGETITTKTYYFTYVEESSVSFCGDWTCDGNENCSTCSNDCGECKTTPQNQTESTTSRKGGTSSMNNINYGEKPAEEIEEDTLVQELEIQKLNPGITGRVIGVSDFNMLFGIVSVGLVLILLIIFLVALRKR